MTVDIPDSIVINQRSGDFLVAAIGSRIILFAACSQPTPIDFYFFCLFFDQ